eukprot:m.109116 g.109116  ORF g.109116 m.109116 type:complete len:129 (+) comp51759_c0_seq11:1019-1405(+)
MVFVSSEIEPSGKAIFMTLFSPLISPLIAIVTANVITSNIFAARVIATRVTIISAKIRVPAKAVITTELNTSCQTICGSAVRLFAHRKAPADCVCLASQDVLVVASRQIPWGLCHARSAQPVVHRSEP